MKNEREKFEEWQDIPSLSENESQFGDLFRSNRASAVGFYAGFQARAAMDQGIDWSKSPIENPQVANVMFLKTAGSEYSQYGYNVENPNYQPPKPRDKTRAELIDELSRIPLPHKCLNEFDSHHYTDSGIKWLAQQHGVGLPVEE